MVDTGRQVRRIEVRLWSLSDVGHVSLACLIAMLQEALADVPEMHRAAATLQIEPGEDWIEALVSYERPETDEEMADRIRVETAREARAAEQAEANERLRLRELAAKYPGELRKYRIPHGEGE